MSVLNIAHVQSSAVTKKLICNWFGGPATDSNSSITSFNLDY
jgi:hypothetical protein